MTPVVVHIARNCDYLTFTVRSNRVALLYHEQQRLETRLIPWQEGYSQEMNCVALPAEISSLRGDLRLGVEDALPLGGRC